jgi:hypothetical protein
MKINFALVPDENLDFDGTEDLFGPDDYGNYFYNAVEFGTNPGGLDEVTIHDTCNRYMPISIESIPELVMALQECYRIAKHLKAAEEVQEAVLAEDTVGVVTDEGIEYKPFESASKYFW